MYAYVLSQGSTDMEDLPVAVFSTEDAARVRAIEILREQLADVELSEYRGTNARDVELVCAYRDNDEIRWANRYVDGNEFDWVNIRILPMDV